MSQDKEKGKEKKKRIECGDKTHIKYGCVEGIDVVKINFRGFKFQLV